MKHFLKVVRMARRADRYLTEVYIAPRPNKRILERLEACKGDGKWHDKWVEKIKREYPTSWAVEAEIKRLANMRGRNRKQYRDLGQELANKLNIKL